MMTFPIAEAVTTLRATMRQRCVGAWSPVWTGRYGLQMSMQRFAAVLHSDRETLRVFLSGGDVSLRTLYKWEALLAAQTNLATLANTEEPCHATTP